MIKIYSDKINFKEFEKRVEIIINDYDNLDKEEFFKEQMLKNEHYLRPTLNIQNTKKYKLLKFIQNILRKSKLGFLEIYGKKLYTKFFLTSNAFIIEEFLRYEDEEFLKIAHKTIFKRDIENSTLNHYLAFLRNGSLSKTEILAILRFSKEGKEKNVNILGLEKRNFIFNLSKVPILGKFFKIFINIAKLPNLVNRLQLLEAKEFLSNQRFNSKIEELSDLNNTNHKLISNVEIDLKDKLNSNINNLEDKINQLSQKDLDLENKINQLSQKNLLLDNKLQNYLDDLILTRRFITNTQKHLSELVSLSKEQISSNNKFLIEEMINLENKKLESFYIAFENRFRGTRDDIKQRQSYYLPFVKNVISSDNDTVLDVGCGRGEWLELLKENHICAKGVDLNSLMIEETLALKLDGKVEDAILYLKSLEEETLSVISGFHIVEHLPFEILVALFDESLRVLKKGGMIIFETPNPENIFVGSCSFYTDPTHINPIPPSTLHFLAENRGFKDVTIHRLHPVKSPIYPEIANANDINTLIFASTKEQDYSIIGYK